MRCKQIDKKRQRKHRTPAVYNHLPIMPWRGPGRVGPCVPLMCFVCCSYGGGGTEIGVLYAGDDGYYFTILNTSASWKISTWSTKEDGRNISMSSISLRRSILLGVWAEPSRGAFYKVWKVDSRLSRTPRVRYQWWRAMSAENIPSPISSHRSAKKK